MTWLTTVIEALPKIRTKLQLSGLIVAVAAVVATRAVVPQAVNAQLSAGAIGVLFIVFGQVFSSLKDFPEQERSRLVLLLFGTFCVFVVTLVEKYTWRPAADVRSFAEVFLHVSAANYNLYKLVGTPPPAGLDVKGLEKSTTDKAQVIATLKDSFRHAKKAIKDMPDADLEKSMDWFGGKNTERGVLLFIVRHAAEHLGQSIAYVRFVGITPPWTEDMQKKQPEKKDASKDKQ